MLLLKLVPLLHRLQLAESAANPLIDWDVDFLDELHQSGLPVVHTGQHVLLVIQHNNTWMHGDVNTAVWATMVQIHANLLLVCE